MNSQHQHGTIMDKRFLAVLIFSFLTTIFGCSTIHKAEEAVADVEQGSAQTALFNITPAQADSVIRAAFKEGWPDKDLSTVGEGRIAYQIKLWFAIDREHIIAEAIDSDNGYVFTVINRGTAPVVGVPARNKLVELLEKHARAIVNEGPN